MKRMLSAFMCAVFFISSAAIPAGAYGSHEDEITTTNKMTFTPNKSAYLPGEEIIITASMESIWGDPDIVDDIQYYEDQFLPGAYGMSALTAAIIFPTDVFTPTSGKFLLDSSTIKNADIANGTRSLVSEATNDGCYWFRVESEIYTWNEDAYAFLTGSGELFRFSLTVSKDAKPGVYRLPVGPYAITDYEQGASNGLPPEFEFFGKWYAWIGNCDSLYTDRPCDYGAGLVGGNPENRASVAYVEIVISDNTILDDPIRGDCNMDGEISQDDADLALKFLAKWNDILISEENSDANNDGDVNLSDVAWILRYIYL